MITFNYGLRGSKKLLIILIILLILPILSLNFIFPENISIVNEDSINLMQQSQELNEDWNVTWGETSGDEQGRGLILDNSSNIYCVGFTDSMGSGFNDLLISKYSSDGIKDWNYTWGGDNYENGQAITLDSEKNIYCAGTQFNPSTQNDILVVKFNSTGGYEWNVTFDYSDYDECWDIILDDSGNIYITGMVQNETDYYEDLLLMKLDNEGNEIWNVTWGGSGTAIGNALKIINDKIYVAGTTVLHGAGARDFLLAEFNITSGEENWNVTWGSTEDDICLDLEIDSDNNLICVGNFNGSTDERFALVKFNLTGHEIWNRTWNSPDADSGTCLSINKFDEIYCGGTIDYGTSTSYLLICYDSEGNLISNSTWGGTFFDRAYDIAIDDSNKMYVIGEYWPSIADTDFVLIKFSLNGPPNISNPSILHEILPYKPVDVNFSVYDPDGLDEIILSYSTNQGSTWTNISQDGNGVTLWNDSIQIPGNVNVTVLYKLYASDINNNWTINDNNTNNFSFFVNFYNEFNVLPYEYTLLDIYGPYYPYMTLNLSTNSSIRINTTVFSNIPDNILNPDNGMSFIEINVNISNYEMNASMKYFYNESDLPIGISEDELDIYTYNGTAWVRLNAILNATGNYLELNLSHFSIYAIIGRESTDNNPPNPPIPGFTASFIFIILISISLVYYFKKKFKIFNLD